jgi:hypothetical protein
MSAGQRRAAHSNTASKLSGLGGASGCQRPAPDATREKRRVVVFFARRFARAMQSPDAPRRFVERRLMDGQGRTAFTLR